MAKACLINRSLPLIHPIDRLRTAHHVSLIHRSAHVGSIGPVSERRSRWHPKLGPTETSRTSGGRKVGPTAKRRPGTTRPAKLRSIRGRGTKRAASDRTSTAGPVVRSPRASTCVRRRKARTYVLWRSRSRRTRSGRCRRGRILRGVGTGTGRDILVAVGAGPASGRTLPGGRKHRSTEVVATARAAKVVNSAALAGAATPSGSTAAGASRAHRSSGSTGLL